VLSLEFAMRFKKLVEQHRVHSIVAHRVDLAFVVAHYQIGVYLSDFLGNQTKFRPVRAVAIVVECHWLKRQNCLAGFIHWLDVFLKPARGTGCPEVAGRVNQYRYGVVVPGCHPTNAADKTTVTHVCTYDRRADTNNIVSRSD